MGVGTSRGRSSDASDTHLDVCYEITHELRSSSIESFWSTQLLDGLVDEFDVLLENVPLRGVHGHTLGGGQPFSLLLVVLPKVQYGALLEVAHPHLLLGLPQLSLTTPTFRVNSPLLSRNNYKSPESSSSSSLNLFYNFSSFMFFLFFALLLS